MTRNKQDVIQQLTKELLDINIVNSWIKKLNLKFKVKILNCSFDDNKVKYEVSLPEYTSEPSIFTYFIVIDLNINTFGATTPYDENKINISSNMGLYSIALLRTLYYLKASLVLINRFLVDPSAIWSEWIKGTPVRKNKLDSLYKWAKVIKQNVHIFIGNEHLLIPEELDVTIEQIKASSVINIESFAQKIKDL